MQYRAIQPFEHNERRFLPGDVLDLPEADVQRLVKDGLAALKGRQEQPKDQGKQVRNVGAQTNRGGRR